jgi:DnaJ-class molecular chaperone
VGGLRLRLASSFVPRDAKPAVLEKAFKKAREQLHPDRLHGLPAAQLHDIEEALRRLTAAYQAEMRRLGYGK